MKAALTERGFERGLSLFLLLAGSVAGLCQTAAANPENPDEDSSLRPVYIRCQRNMQRPNFEELYPKDWPLPENIIEYPDLDEESRYSKFKELRLEFNQMTGNGLMTASRAGEMLAASLPLLHSDYPLYRIHYWTFFADMAHCLTPTNGVSAMEQDEIIGIARNLKAVLSDMDRAVIPDFKGYWPPFRYHGYVGHLPGERVYSYNGRPTTKREDIYQFMRDERIVDTKQAMNSEQYNLPRFRSLIAEALEILCSSANAKANGRDAGAGKPRGTLRRFE